MAKRETVKESARPAPTAPDSEKRETPRLSLPLGPDGSIDWTMVRESRKGPILSMLQSDPQIRAGLGGGAAASSSGNPIFSAPMAGMLFDILGNLEVSIVMRSMGVTRDRAAVMLYSEEDRAILTGPLVTVLNKYGSSWLAKWGDEIALAGLFVAVHAPKLSALSVEPTRPADVLTFTPPADAPAAESGDADHAS